MKKTWKNENYSKNNPAYTLAGAVFHIKNNQGTQEYDLPATDANGETSIKGIAIGDYTVTETKAPQWYEVVSSFVTPKGTKDADIELGYSSPDIRLAEQEELTRFDLYKVSCNPALTDSNLNYDLRTAKFKLTATWNASVSYDLYLNMSGGDRERGHAYVENIPLGTYKLEEIDPPTGYVKNEVGQWTLTASHGATFEYEVCDPPKYSPMGLYLDKLDPENGVLPQGDASLTGAVFHFDFYGELLSKGQVASGGYRPIVSFDATTVSYNGVARISLNQSSGCINTGSFYSSRGHSISEYFAPNGDFMIPIGTFAVYEASAPDGYNVARNVIGDYQGDGNYPSNAQGDGLYVSQVHDNNGFGVQLTALNRKTVVEYVPWTGSVRVTKIDNQERTIEPQGNATMRATFELYNRSRNDIFIHGVRYPVNGLIATLTTDPSTCSVQFDNLPEGTYDLVEVSTHSTYNLVPYTRHFTIRRAGQLVDYSSPTAGSRYDAAANAVKRGGVSLYKITDDFVWNRPSGDGTLAGAEFTIWNRSTHYVRWPDNSHRAAPGEVVTTITTDANGFATTGNNFLPIGTYEIKETKPSQGYRLNTAWDKVFSITYERQVIMYDDYVAIENTGANSTSNHYANPELSIRGGVRIYKSDRDRIDSQPEGDESKGQGDAHLQGAVFRIYNKSQWPVKVNGTEYPVNGMVLQLTTNGQGIAVSAADTLPYGTYLVQEYKAPAGYFNDSGSGLHATGWSSTIQIRNHGEIVEANNYVTGTRRNPVREAVYRGGFRFSKRDGEKKVEDYQGDGRLNGTFRVYNDSDYSVYVGGTFVSDAKGYQGGHWVEPGGVVLEFTTDPVTGIYNSP